MRENNKKTKLWLLLLLMLILAAGAAAFRFLWGGFPGKKPEAPAETESVFETSMAETESAAETNAADDEGEIQETTKADTETTDSAANPEISGLEVHYIDVGQGDAALILCGGEAMLIDGGRGKESSKIYSYLKSHEIAELKYIAASHPDSDHIGGLSGALNAVTAENAFCSVASYDSEPFSDFVKYLTLQGISITVPKRGDTFSLGSALGEILGPVKSYGDTNDDSLVIRITYGNTSFLFTGDAEYQAEQDMLSSGEALSATVLKVGHHGSSTSSSEAFLEAVSPEYAVISVGEANDYGHPANDTLIRLFERNTGLFRTDLQGTIICSSDGEKVAFSVEKNPDADVYSGLSDRSLPGYEAEIIVIETLPEEELDYVVNVRTMKFHYPLCEAAQEMKEHNRMDYHGTRESLIREGYVPCKLCDP